MALLTRNAKLYSHRRLIEAAEERGHEIHAIDTLKIYFNVSASAPQIRYKGALLEGFDAIIPRIGASITFFGAAVVRQFEVMGVYSVNDSQAIARSRDKLRSIQVLARRGIGIPDTGFAHGTRQTDDMLDMLGGAPLVIKLIEGTQGMGVVLGETRKAVSSVMNAFGQLKANFLVQEFIKEAGNSDIRCLVVGDRVVAAMMRKGAKGDFRSNLHRGGTALAVKITPQERKTAVKAARAMGLKVCGVDLLRSNRGPLVLEVNSSPGLQGVEKATGVDVAGKIIKYIEENARPKPTRSRWKG
ncbi:MAG: 30S ribosomal protein S6--L-glutamate ligase [Proteobacteria bacterium]|nr:30S ribosomal protein S6--L-glutamate ligase [Pseudomonadota bacterium]